MVMEWGDRNSLRKRGCVEEVWKEIDKRDWMRWDFKERDKEFRRWEGRNLEDNDRRKWNRWSNSWKKES